MFPNGSSVTIEAELDDLRFSIKNLSNLGIMVNEIVTNSMKYAFPDGRPGTIALSSRISGDRVVIAIGDDGVGMPEAESLEGSTGFGLSLIRILAKQMDARVSIAKGRGLSYFIELGRG